MFYSPVEISRKTQEIALMASHFASSEDMLSCLDQATDESIPPEVRGEAIIRLGEYVPDIDSRRKVMRVYQGLFPSNFR